MSLVKIASFNFENLFERSIALNFKDQSAGNKILQDVADFQAEIEKASYDYDTMLRKYLKVKDYVTISEERGKLFKRYRYRIVGLKAFGRNDS